MESNDQEGKMVIEGSESLKPKDFVGEMLHSSFEGLLFDPEKMTPEQNQKYEERKKKKREGS